MEENRNKKIYFPTFFLVLIYFASFITLPYFEYYNLFKYCILLVCGIYSLFNIFVLGNYKLRKINILLIAYLISIIVSAYINKDVGTERNSFLASIVFCGSIFETVIIMERYFHDNKIDKLVNVLFNITLYVLIINDFLIFVGYNHPFVENYYLIGNKFTVSYTHILLLALYFYKIKKYDTTIKNIIFICLSITTLTIDLLVKCSTGIVGLIVFYIISMFIKEKHLIKSKLFFIFIFTLSFTFFLTFDLFLNNDFVKYIIVDILGEDITLTGRISIYQNIIEVLDGHYLFGYGYGNSFEVMMSTIGAPNSQNGLLECILTQGVISTTILITMIMYSTLCKKYKKNNFLIAIIYMFIILSSIEITFGSLFLIVLVLSYLIDNYEGEDYYESSNFINAKNC